MTATAASTEVLRYPCRQRRGPRPRIESEPFRQLAASARAALEELGDRLARFVEPHEPTVYRRYQRWRKV